MNSKYGFDFAKNNELHTKQEKSYPKRGVIAFAPMHILACDLVDYSKIPRKGFHYILNCVDVFSRKAESANLRTKSGKDIQKGFQQVFEKFGQKPRKIWFDQESGVVSGDTKNWLRQRQIELYHTFGLDKVSIAERFNRTQKSILYKYEMANPNNKWCDFVQEFVLKYNDTKHKSLGMTPNEAFSSKAKEALTKNLERYYQKRETKKSPTVFKVGDRVRIFIKQETFSKGYQEKWSREVYVVSKVHPTNPTTYIVKDSNGNDMIGGYYAQELLRATMI